MEESSGFHPGVRGFDSRSRHMPNEVAIGYVTGSEGDVLDPGKVASH